MNTFFYWLYVATVGLIRVYKWIEFQVLVLFTPVLKSYKNIFRNIDIEIEDVNEFKNKQNSKQLCCKRYDRIVKLKIRDPKTYARIANLGSLGAGECFMDKSLDVEGENYEDITELTRRVLERNYHTYYYYAWNRLLEYCELHLFNLQCTERAFQVGVEHYDLGNQLFESMLDPWMQYTCGYWRDGITNLNDAQIAKMELIARKLDLKKGMRVLDIGCGWGTLCKYLAEKYQVECVGVTISKEGVAYGKKICQGLPVDIRLQDYRDVNEQFDRIVSVGMFEHVGHWNYKTFFGVAKKCLARDGIFLLHTIAKNHENIPRSEFFSNKYIFVNGCLPTPEDITKTSKGFIIEDWHNFGADYAKTLLCWRENFLREWPKLKGKYDDKFFRMWIFYLCIARGLFLSRKLQLYQIVFSKDGLKREYRAAR